MIVTAVFMDLMDKATNRWGKKGKLIACSGLLFLFISLGSLPFIAAYFVPMNKGACEAEASGISSQQIFGPKGIRLFP